MTALVIVIAVIGIAAWIFYRIVVRECESIDDKLEFLESRIENSGSSTISHIQKLKTELLGVSPMTKPQFIRMERLSRKISNLLSSKTP